MKENSGLVLGIDPGKKGAFVLLDRRGVIEFMEMPLNASEDVDFGKVWDYLELIPKTTPVFLERAIPFAQGAKQAFNYGRGFAALEIALWLAKLPVKYIEPAKWTKAMHAGISADLKPKVKSVIAFERLFPAVRHVVPKSKKGAYHDGIVEALLIAAYGKTTLKNVEDVSLSDF